MKKFVITLFITATLALFAEEWKLTTDASLAKELTFTERTLDVYHHDSKKAWDYATPQKDTFMVLHPKTDRKNAPLYVVLHSAGHDVISCMKCTKTVGNHDIYHAPEEFYALYLDCRANKGDWWWGGMHVKDANLTKKNSGGNPMPVERRVIDTVKWVMKKHSIDPERVYLCGNSMGGSGTLGIGVRNGDLFAAIKANVPAGIEHVSNRMYFPQESIPEGVTMPDPPIVIDYSAPNDGWSFGHDRFVKAMNDRKYPLYFYWGPFGHANNNAKILAINDLVHSFDWLKIKKNEAYAAFTNASDNDKLPWPDNLTDTKPGQVNAFFRWKLISDGSKKLEMSLFLVSETNLKTSFSIPTEAAADVTLRRIQKMKIKPGESVKWSFGDAKGEVNANADGSVTIPKLKITTEPAVLSCDL